MIEDNENTRRLLRYLLRKDWTPTLTAYAMPGDAETFADHGFDAYLAKPFANELMETLRRVAG